MANSKSHHSGSLSPEMALLGLLYGSPGHGYDLHRRVITDLGQVWHLSQSQAYAILKRLEAKGEITTQAVPQEKLPPRQLLHITPKGRARFLDWLYTPSGGSVRQVRLEFITRIYLLQQYQPDKAEQAFEQQRMEVSIQILHLEKMVAELPERQLYNRMSLEMRIKQLKAVQEWLEQWQRYFHLPHA